MENATTTQPVQSLELTTGLLIAYVSIWVMAVIPIYIGSYLSLKETKNESMSKNDAYAFPLYGSVFLFGLYLLFKNFDKNLINTVLSLYFLMFGAIAMTKLLSTLLKSLFSSAPTKQQKKQQQQSKSEQRAPDHLVEFTLPSIKFVLDSQKVSIGYFDVIAFVISCLFSLFYLQTKHWIANNVFGLTFSIQGIGLISLSEYIVGVILLVGLFFYDIFWVFGTDVMVTVAKSFDAPIKLLFPKDVFAEVYQFSMLGLGDIVLPGIFIALLLRFDRYQAQKNKKPFTSTPYFTTTLIAYGLGLATTIFVMHTFRAAQPALLYLVPFCVGASLLTGLFKGQLRELVFSDLGKETKAE
ncbi:peptidase A22B family protein [Tieghemostelium lacteum]|uniref:Peptidase A22B family protein n=1 Tax=Tieghemostelium lacteum TaxID=361077 RepID=A0A151ZDT5_TIELA|nr:peptidase A22B family protein [Tieghemostelium lacteum]|eukprot:KYQ92101.1 peptidase A22B family protein [Tieghemostelium lacteum]